jgi:hypothetical protein
MPGRSPKRNVVTACRLSAGTTSRVSGGIQNVHLNTNARQVACVDAYRVMYNGFLPSTSCRKRIQEQPQNDEQKCTHQMAIQASLAPGISWTRLKTSHDGRPPHGASNELSDSFCMLVPFLNLILMRPRISKAS